MSIKNNIMEIIFHFYSFISLSDIISFLNVYCQKTWQYMLRRYLLKTDFNVEFEYIIYNIVLVVRLGHKR